MNYLTKVHVYEKKHAWDTIQTRYWITNKHNTDNETVNYTTSKITDFNLTIKNISKLLKILKTQ